MIWPYELESVKLAKYGLDGQVGLMSNNDVSD